MNDIKSERKESPIAVHLLPVEWFGVLAVLWDSANRLSREGYEKNKPVLEACYILTKTLIKDSKLQENIPVDYRGQLRSMVEDIVRTQPGWDNKWRSFFERN